jgi:hypothetical protein
MAQVLIITGIFLGFPKSKPLEKVKVVEPDSPIVAHYRTMGAYQMAWHLRQHDIATQVLDFVQFMTVDQLEKYVRKFLVRNEPSVLGLSSTFYDADREPPKNVTEVISRLRADPAYSQMKVVIGGSLSHFARPGKDGSDYSVGSYAEDAGLDLILGILKRAPIPLNFKLNPAIKQENSKFNITQSQHRFTKEDAIRESESLPLEVSRGCIFKCSFCRYPHIGKKKNDYIREVEHIKAELLYNYENFKTTNYYLLDDTFNETPEKVKAFYDMTQTLPFAINYVAYIRADLLHRYPETLVWLRDSGLSTAFFGIESFHPEASKSVSKAWSGKHGKEFIKEIKEGPWKTVSLTLSLIMGLPGETKEDMIATAKWCVENNIDNWSWHLLSISRDATGGQYGRENASEFEKDPAKFGFTFSDDGAWYNGHASKAEVAKWFVEITNYDKKLKPRASAWTLIEMMNYFPKDVLFTTKSRKLRDELATRRGEWYQAYLAKLDQLPGIN